MHCEAFTVTRNTNSAVENNESTGKSTRSGLDCASYAPTAFEFAEAFGGGSEYFPFSRLPLWPLTSIRLFRQEEEQMVGRISSLILALGVLTAHQPITSQTTCRIAVVHLVDKA